MKKMKALIRKELLDILRDRKTLVMMVVVPVLLYPLILIGMSLIMVNVMESQEEAVHTIGISAEYDTIARELEAIYQEQEEEIGLKLEFVSAEAGDEEVRQSVDAWLEIAEESVEESVEETAASEASAAAESVLRVQIQYASTSDGGSATSEAAEELLERYRQQLVEQNLEREGLPESFLYPVEVKTEDSATVSESLGMDIGGSIGMMLIVTILLGAVYPAIDATAGEKERGTLETLLTLPVTSFQMIASKYVSVAVFACTTAVISLLSLGGSVLFLIYGVAGAAAEETQLFSFSSILTMLPVLMITMIVTGLLISALCMCFCVFARSFKEANNYVTPVLLVVMFASMAGMIPSIHLDYKTALIPIVNVSLLIKQVLSQHPDFALIGLTILMNFLYSVAVVWVLAKMYDSEEILFSDGFRSFRLFQKRCDIRPGTIPAGGDLVISVIVLFLLLMYLGSAVSVRSAMAGTAVSQLLILAVPLLAVWYLKSDAGKLFALKAPSPKKLPGNVLLYIGTYCLMLFLSMILTGLFPESTQNVETSFGILLEQPIWMVLLVLAVFPAVGEEILFRGFLFGSLRERYGWKWALLISSLVFGAFHMSLVKLIPTALLGAAFGYMVYTGGSIYVTMALHFLNNALSLAVSKYPEQAMKIVPFLAKEQLSVTELAVLLAVGAVCIGVGMLFTRKAEKAG